MGDISRYGREEHAIVFKCMRCNALVSLSYYQRTGELVEVAQKSEIIKVIFGIHPDAIRNYYWREPLMQEKFYFCFDCGKEIFGRMAEAIAVSILDSFDLLRLDSEDFRAEILESLLKKPDMPEYESEKGHWITYWEKKAGVDGKYFNIQIPCELFLGVMERLKEDFFSGYSLPYKIKLEKLKASLSTDVSKFQDLDLCRSIFILPLTK